MKLEAEVCGTSEAAMINQEQKYSFLVFNEIKDQEYFCILALESIQGNESSVFVPLKRFRVTKVQYSCP